MPALVVVVVVSGVVKKPKVTRAGAHRGSLRLLALGWGGEGRLLLAWHAVRWWGAGGQGCPSDGGGGVGRTTLGSASRSLGLTE